MGPNKIQWHLGASSLSMIMEQERRHWLLKTSTNITTQDKITGDMFRGRVENLGSDIIVETEKLPVTDIIVHDGVFTEDNLNYVFELAKSALPFIPKMNGLHFTRLTSINLMTAPDVYHNFRFVFRNCEIIYVPISSDKNSSNVFVYKWLRTTTKPVVQSQDGNVEFEVDIRIFRQVTGNSAPTWVPNKYYGKNSDGYFLTTQEPQMWSNIYSMYYTRDEIVNGVYYYPLDAALQKIPLDTYADLSEVPSIVITDETLIGSPAIWFTCDDVAYGPAIALSDNGTTSTDDVSLLLEVGNPGNQTKYQQRLYPATGDENYVTPDGTTMDIWNILCRPKSGTFTNTPSDFDMPIGDIIFAVEPSAPQDGQLIGTSGSVGNNTITMARDIGWTYIDDSMYAIPLVAFFMNPYNQQTEPLLAAFNVKMDASKSFDITTTDIGYAGMRFGSSKNTEEQQPRYPHDIYKMDGLPDHLTDPDASPQHLSIYALHNTPSYNPEDQSTRQIAGLIFDPGVERKYNMDYHPGQYQVLQVDIADGGSGYAVDDGVWVVLNSGERSKTFYQINAVDANGAVTRITPVYWDEGLDPVKEPQSDYEEAYDPVSLIGTVLSTIPNTVEGQSSTAGTGLKLSIFEQYIEEKVPPFTESDIPNDEIGRVYVLSNDGIEYVNNARSETPKPERTMARICDIPSSVMQLTNIHGLAPTSIVDKKYIRSYASITEEDIDRIQNGLHDRWVRPTHLDSNAHPIYVDGEECSNSNAYVFDSMEKLNRVDLYNHNDFRSYSNLNPMVTVSDIEVNAISNPGSGYTTESAGFLVIGGFAFTYHVNAVNELGSVTSVTIYPTSGSLSDKISLSNFDIAGVGASGVTVPYGTSPMGDTTGTGLKISLRINHYDELLPVVGPIFDDLYAFAEDVNGIWFCAYNVTESKWKQIKLVAEKSVSETTSSKGNVSTRDAYINSILPSLRSITVGLLENMGEIPVYAYKTAAAINVIDPNVTPVSVPNAEGDGLIDSKQVIDINKYYCRGMQQLHSASRNFNDVVAAIREANLDRFDCFIFWDWVNAEDPTDTNFTFGIVHRSLDNLMSTDVTSELPENNLTNPKFVHTNAQTTLMWNVDHVGPMIWMYDPASTIHERYYVNAHTRELYVTRDEFKWADVQVVNTVNDMERQIHLVVDGVLQYNIMTNNPWFFTDEEWPHDPDTIYQQPDFKPVTGLYKGAVNLSGPRPRGSWRLVFPEVHSFTIRQQDGTEYPAEFTPVRMNIIRGSDLQAVSDVLNEEGTPVNYKTLILNEKTSTRRVEPMVYDQETGEWNII